MRTTAKIAGEKNSDATEAEGEEKTRWMDGRRRRGSPDHGK
jgi:hypothetical protein